MITRQAKVDGGGAISSAIRTIETEKAGLVALSAALQGEMHEVFRAAVGLIGGIAGRLIVTGIGKSGHIGTKLAATLASTGTPSFFVHPVEANHGDLGMIGRDDVILALSWSGETVELQGIVSYSRRFAIPLIAMTSGERSALARAADIVLLLPKVQEACPHGLAPTTSTLMQLALGDAIAVALLEARGFTATDFKTFHPGGKLGASLSHVGDIMHSGENMPLVALGTSMPDAVNMLAQKRYGCVGVIDGEGTLVGIVTDGDIARNLSRNLSELTVDEVMTRSPKTVKPATLATAALGLLNQHNISALIVTDEAFRPIGIVHFHDLLRIGAA